jgi:hypothetical protein
MAECSHFCSIAAHQVSERLGLDEELIPGFGKSVLVAAEHWLPQAFEESG